MKNDVTIYDIASALNVSPSTVSRALSGTPLVRSGTRNRILEKARDLGYRPNLFASSLRAQRSGMVGVIVPLLTEGYTSSFVSGIEVMARQSSLNLVIRQSMKDVDLLRQNIEDLGHSRVDGLLISAIGSPLISSAVPAETRIPCVVLESVTSSKNGSGDDQGSYTAYASTKDLIGKGCKRIVFAGSHANDSNEAHHGYIKALEEHFPENSRSGKINIDVTLTCALEVLSNSDNFPDGIVYSNGLSAGLTIRGMSNFCNRDLQMNGDAGTTKFHGEATSLPALAQLGEFAGALLIKFIEHNRKDLK